MISIRRRLAVSLLGVCALLVMLAPAAQARPDRSSPGAHPARHRSHAARRRRRHDRARSHRSRAAGRRARRRAHRFHSRAIRVPPQSVTVTPRGGAIVFVSCASSTACRGTLTLRLAGAERGAWESRPGTGEWQSLPVAWRRWSVRSPRPAVIVHRRVSLRQRRVNPIALRLRRPVLSILRRSGAPLQLEAVTSWGHGHRSVGPITLQLARRRAQVA